MNDTDLVDEKLASRLQPICAISAEGFIHEPCGQTFHSFGGGADSLLDHPCPALTPEVVMARAQAYMESLA